mgnify:CR=1 FL=1
MGGNPQMSVETAMRLIKNLWGRLSRAVSEAATDSRDLSERRNAPRYADGSWISLVEPDTSMRSAVWAASESGGACVSAASVSSATMLDVSATGVRFRSSSSLPMNRRVYCRLQFKSGPLDLGMRIMWARTTSHGYEYGARYVAALPGTERLLDTYARGVLGRTAAGA